MNKQCKTKRYSRLAKVCNVGLMTAFLLIGQLQASPLTGLQLVGSETTHPAFVRPDN